MLVSARKEKDLRLKEFERQDASASLNRGQPVIPVWLDWIHQQLARRLKG